MSLKLAILASGSGTNAEAMFKAVERGLLDADIRLVLANRRAQKCWSARSGTACPPYASITEPFRTGRALTTP